MTTEVKSQPTLEQLQAQIRQLETRLAEKGTAPGVRIAIGAKGGVSVYGVGRFPVTLYEGQWERLNAVMPEVMTFIKANTDKLAKKPEGYKSQEPTVRSSKVQAA